MVNAPKQFFRLKRKTAMAAAIAAVLASSATAFAAEFDVGNSDFNVRWDNSVRYNLGVRAKDCDPNICANTSEFQSAQSDQKFSKKGNVITNRLDLLSELDVVYKDDSGLRVSAAAWADQAYSNTSSPTAPGGFNVFPGGHYTQEVNRWNRGVSGEILDAFLFTKVNLGDVPVNLRLGQHNIYWGESLFSLVGGVSYGQGPIDFRKAFANPGAEAKELFMPLNQLSFSAALGEHTVLAGQYLLDWKASRLPDGGTYFGGYDFLVAGGGTSYAGTTRYAGSRAPADKRGDWGLSLKMRPEWLEGSLGLYYRQLTDKLPQYVIDGSNFEIITDYQSPRQKLIGASLAKSIAGVSIGADVTYRKDALIQSGFGLVGSGPSTPAFNTGDWRPRGEVFTALVNMIAYFGKNPVFDSAALTAEMNYSNLRKITNNPDFFLGANPWCGQGSVSQDPEAQGCPTKRAVGINLAFEPKWFQVFPGVDLSMPTYYARGLSGNSPVPFGDKVGQGNYSVGVAADIDSKYSVVLKYNGFIAKHSQDALGSAGVNNSGGGKYWDRNWISLTAKATF